MLSSSSSVGSVNLNYYDLDNVLTPPETEHNWAAKETAMKNLGAACHSGIAQNHEYIQFIKNHRKAFAESLLTERTRLSGAACELVEKLATAMGRDFGSHCADLFTGPLLKVCARTNKVMVTRAVKALTSMINAGTISVLPKTCTAFASPNKTQRIACINLIATCVSQFSPQELEPHLPSLEPVLKEGVQDAAPEVRDTSRKSFKVYAAQFPERSTVLTSTLPGNVLKYLLPDTRSSASLLGRPTTPGLAGRRSPMGRLADGGDAMRSNLTREPITGPTRAAATSRVGPVRARTMPVSEGPSTLKASSVQHTPSTTQPYNYSHNQPSKPTTSTLSLSSSRHLGVRATSYSESSSTTDGLGGAPPLRSASQRSRNLTSGSIANSNLMQRSQAINLTSNGGPQRVVSGGHFSNNHAHPTSTHTSTNSSDPKPRPTSFLRSSKAEPISKAGRISSSSGNTEPMSASERAKAYSASLKNEMAIRRAGSASADLTMRNNGPRRLNMDQHIQQQQQQQHGYSVYGSSASSSSVASITTSTAPSTSSVSPISSTSTSPTTAHSPAHDQLFNSFRGPLSPQTASSPPESCASPDYGRGQSPLPASSAMDSEVTSAVPAPLSPTVLAQISIVSQSTESLHQVHASRESSPHASFSSESSPLVHGTTLAQGSLSAHGSPHSPEHTHHSQASLPAQPFQPSDEAMQHISEDVEFSEPNVPDHESLFGPTEEYLKAEKEIQEQREQLHRLQVAHTHTNGHFHPEQDEDESKQSSYMDEDPRLAYHEQTEELAVKVYADEYEATLAAASCSSTSLSSSLGEE